jgi:glycosyltransferase involved in cell wall biosynthesis
MTLDNLKAKRILIVINNLDFLLSHRKEILEMLLKNNSSIFVASPRTKSVEELESLNIKHFELNISRSGINPFSELITLFKLFKITNKVKPHLIHTITMKGIIHGGLIAKIYKLPNLIAFSGLGHVFTNQKASFKKTFTKKTVNYLLKLILSNPKKLLVFHNQDDLKELKDFHAINDNDTLLTYGSGIDLAAFSYLHLPTFKSNKTIGLFASRLLKTKGVEEIFHASEIIYQENRNIEIWIVGEIDDGNPDSINKDFLNQLAMKPNIKYFGFHEKIYSFLRDCHFVLLPSHREGMPKVLLEASASGRAIITTNVPGCRDCVYEGRNGFLVKSNNYKDLAAKIIKISESENQLIEFGKFSMKVAQDNYSVEKVVDQHKQAYISLLN